MKVIIALGFLSLTSMTFAATCFEAVDRKFAFIPKEICFEKFEASTDSEILFITGSDVLPERMMTSYFTRKNEDYYRFRASQILKNEWEAGCGYGQKTIVKLEGLTDNWGEVNPLNLDVSIEFERTNDTCHSRPQTGSVVYKLK